MGVGAGVFVGGGLFYFGVGAGVGAIGVSVGVVEGMGVCEGGGQGMDDGEDLCLHGAGWEGFVGGHDRHGADCARCPAKESRATSKNAAMRAMVLELKVSVLV